MSNYRTRQILEFFSGIRGAKLKDEDLCIKYERLIGKMSRMSTLEHMDYLKLIEYVINYGIPERHYVYRNGKLENSESFTSNRDAQYDDGFVESRDAHISLRGRVWKRLLHVKVDVADYLNKCTLMSDEKYRYVWAEYDAGKAVKTRVGIDTKKSNIPKVGRIFHYAYLHFEKDFKMTETPLHAHHFMIVQVLVEEMTEVEAAFCFKAILNSGKGIITKEEEISQLFYKIVVENHKNMCDEYAEGRKVDTKEYAMEKLKGANLVLEDDDEDEKADGNMSFELVKKNLPSEKEPLPVFKEEEFDFNVDDENGGTKKPLSLNKANNGTNGSGNLKLDVFDDDDMDDFDIPDDDTDDFGGGGDEGEGEPNPQPLLLNIRPGGKQGGVFNTNMTGNPNAGSIPAKNVFNLGDGFPDKQQKENGPKIPAIGGDLAKAMASDFGDDDDFIIEDEEDDPKEAANTSKITLITPVMAGVSNIGVGGDIAKGLTEESILRNLLTKNSKYHMLSLLTYRRDPRMLDLMVCFGPHYAFFGYLAKFVLRYFSDYFDSESVFSSSLLLGKLVDDALYNRVKELFAG